VDDPKTAPNGKPLDSQMGMPKGLRWAMFLVSSFLFGARSGSEGAVSVVVDSGQRRLPFVILFNLVLGPSPT
jgi:hypothetical protein